MTQYKRLKKVEQICQFSSKNWNKVYTFCQDLRTLSKSINIARYVFKLIYMLSSGLSWNVCEGFAGLQLYL